MKIIVFLMFLVFSTNSFAVESSHVYLCRKCDISVIKVDRKNTLYYSAGGSHTWDLLAQISKNQYQCHKCSRRISTRDRPGHLPSIVLLVAVIIRTSFNCNRFICTLGRTYY